MRKPNLARKRESGAAAVEFAIVINLFLLLVMATIDYGYYFYVTEVVTNAAREGARAGSVVDPTAANSTATAQAQQIATGYLQSGGLKKAATVTATITQVGATPATAVQVVVKYPAGSVTGFLPQAMIPSYSNATAVMRWQ